MLTVSVLGLNCLMMGCRAETNDLTASLVSSYSFLEVPCEILTSSYVKVNVIVLITLRSLLLTQGCQCHSVQVIRAALYFGNPQTSR